MEDIIRTCNSMVRFSKFTSSNKKILAEFDGFLCKLVWRETFSGRHTLKFEKRATFGSYLYLPIIYL